MLCLHRSLALLYNPQTRVISRSERVSPCPCVARMSVSIAFLMVCWMQPPRRSVSCLREKRTSLSGHITHREFEITGVCSKTCSLTGSVCCSTEGPRSLDTENLPLGSKFEKSLTIDRSITAGCVPLQALERPENAVRALGAGS